MDQGQMVNWLTRELEKREFKNARVYEKAVRVEHDWYYVPVNLDMGDAYDNAVALQQIEDEWEKQRKQLGEPGHDLLLIPAAR